MNKFREIEPTKIPGNVIKMIAQDWMLITSGRAGDFNTMTASWGGLGNLWGLPVAFVFVRPSRYTYEFMERSPNFTLSFFDSGYRKPLMFCGTKSGRDVDKVAATGFTPLSGVEDSVYFAESRLVLTCKTLYGQAFLPENFVVPAVCESVYGTDTDLHKFYVGEIIDSRIAE